MREVDGGAVVAAIRGAKKGAMGCLFLDSRRRVEVELEVEMTESSEQLWSRWLLMSFSATVREHIGLAHNQCEQAPSDDARIEYVPGNCALV